MAGLFALLFGTLVGGAKIAEGIDNLHAKQNVYTLPNGIKYYYDNKGTQRLMDGTIVVADCAGTFKTIDGRLLYSKKNDEDEKAATATLGNKYRVATQHHPRCEGPATVELSTGKIIARVEEKKKKDGTFEYRKWYFKDIFIGKSNEEIKFYSKPRANNWDFNDPGILISAEEFNAINTCPKLGNSGHQYYHDLYVGGKKDVTFYAYSEPWYRKIDSQLELAKKFVMDGGRDGWYKEKIEQDLSNAVYISPDYSKYWKVGEIYVEKGYAIKRRRRVNDEIIEEYPYCRETGDRWFSVKMSYITFSKYKEDAWTWIAIEPCSNGCVHLDYLFQKEEVKMRIPNPVD